MGLDPGGPRIEIKGLDKLERKFEELGKDFGPVVKDLMKEGALFAQSQIAPYPPPPPGSLYTRTGTLGRTTVGLSREAGENAYEGILGNPTSYSPWVVSDQRGLNGAGPQAWFHAGRWETLQAVVKRSKSGIISVIRRGINELLRK